MTIYILSVIMGAYIVCVSLFVLKIYLPKNIKLAEEGEKHIVPIAKIFSKCFLIVGIVCLALSSFGMLFLKASALIIFIINFTVALLSYSMIVFSLVPIKLKNSKKN